MGSANGHDVAIVGLACRLPGAPDAEAFWRNLCEGTESIRHYSRAELQGDIDARLLDHPGWVGASGPLDDADSFDAAFFGLTAREAELLDPQYRLFFECAWSALEDAGYDPFRFRDRIGCFAGAGMSLYAGPRMRSYFVDHLLPADELLDQLDGPQVIVGNFPGYLASRLSYKFDLRGPSFDVHTACSTGLVAVHLACQSLLSGECEMAIAGAAAIHLPLRSGYLYQPGGILSPDGRCRPFDAAAAGTVGGNGGGAVVLKRLADAQADGDHIHAVIKGSAINNDGKQKVSYLAPSIAGQVEVIRAALRAASIDAASIGFVEAHGSATALGDSIELTALREALGTPRRARCALGSVKGNIGHLDTAAGIAGLIKAVLAVENGTVPPTVHFRSPAAGFDDNLFVVNTGPIPWTVAGERRRAAVSSLGAGGTNAHAVLEEAPPPPPRVGGDERPVHVMALSAPTQTGLRELARRHAGHLASRPEIVVSDRCFTINTGRRQFAYRAAFVGETGEELAEQLEAFARGAGVARVDEQPRVAFLFSGQGAQHPGMGAALYRSQPLFRDAVHRCDALLRPLLGFSVVAKLFAGGEVPRGEDGDDIDDTRIAQPALFTVEYALVELLASWGIVPDALLGHSVGEIAAACCAGVMDLPTAARLVAERSRAMGALPRGGAMLAVHGPPSLAWELREGDLAVAAINGPQAFVLSGPVAAIERAHGWLSARQVRTARLSVSHAFHSPLMQPAVEPLRRALRTLSFTPPRLPIADNVSGNLDGRPLASPDYWCTQLASPVQFAAGITALAASGVRVFVELGPRPVLLGVAATCVSDGSWLPTLQPRSEWKTLSRTVAALYQAGVAVDWHGFDRPYPRRRVSLPTYPYERKRFWVKAGARAPDAKGSTAALLDRGDTEALLARLGAVARKPEARSVVEALIALHRGEAPGTDIAASTVTWVDSAPAPGALADPWVIFGDGGGLGAALAGRLERAGCHVTHARDSAAASLLGRSRASVIDLRALDEPVPAGALDVPRWRCCVSALEAAQALLDAPSGRSLWLVTRGAVPASPDTALAIEQSPLWGAARVLRVEAPELRCVSVDLDPGDASPAQTLWNELSCGNEPREIAFRDGARKTSLLRPCSLAAARPSLRSDGTYLVTGAFGDIGRAVVKRLAELGARSLLLLGRRIPDEWRAEAARWSSRGVRARAVGLDVADGEALRRLLAEVRSSTWPLRGIVHAAGVAEAASVAHCTAESLERALAAKATGAWHLHSSSRGDPLDFFVCLSSVASSFGAPGLYSYAAASAVLDALMQERRRLGLPGVSVALGPIEGTGMWARRGKGPAPRLSTRTVDDVVSLVDRALEWPSLDGHVVAVGSPEDRSLSTAALDCWSLAQPPRAPFAARLAAARPAERGRLALGHVRAVVASLLGVEPDAVDVDQPLRAAGLDSLTGLRLRNALAADFATELPMTLIYRWPTVHAISEQLAGDPVTSCPGGELDALSDSELAELLRRELRAFKEQP